MGFTFKRRHNVLDQNPHSDLLMFATHEFTFATINQKRT